MFICDFWFFEVEPPVSTGETPDWWVTDEYVKQLICLYKQARYKTNSS